METARRPAALADPPPSVSPNPPHLSPLWLSHMAAKPGIVPSLNGLRALSIIVVFLSHVVDDRLFPGGFGVRVFFVISGFLITRMLFLEMRQTGTIRIAAFYLRRVLRLYPAILVYAAVIVGLALWRGEPFRVMEPVSALLYVANYYYAALSKAGADPTLPFTVFWSLALEEHFYLIFPLAFALLGGRARRVALLCVALAAVCLGLRTLGAGLRPDLLTTYTFYMETQYQLDAIGFGVGLAACCEFEGGRALVQRLSGPVPIAVACAVIVACFAVRNAFFRETLRYSLQSAAVVVAMSAVLFRAYLKPAQRLLNTWVLDGLGRLSYGIYVWHTGVVYLLHKPPATPFNVLVQTGLTLLLAILSYRVVEHPLASLRHKLGSVAPPNAV